MSRARVGGWAIAGLAAVNVALWLIELPVSRDPELNNLQQIAGEMLSTTAIVLVACTLVLSTRAGFLEPFFGGLDRMYQAHKRTSLAAITLLAGHALLMPRHAALVPGPLLGVIGFGGMAVLILLTLAPRLPLTRLGFRLPYHQWKFTHKFVGAFFLAGLLHSFNVENLTQESPLTDLYGRGLGLVAAVVYLYRVLLHDFVKRKYAYAVEAVRRLNGNTVEISLKPLKDRLAHRAGQFLFVHFPGAGPLAEPHPFTISSAPGEPNLRLSIKASGDFTQRLYDRVQADMPASIEGPYGRLDYRSGAPRQVWVAGGIGVTPFLSWMRDLSDGAFELHFFYTVRDRSEALFWEEIEQTAAKLPNFKPHLHCSNQAGRLSVETIAGQVGDLGGMEVYLCGPLPMTESLHRQFVAAGVPAGRIHFEEFNFR